MSRLRIALCAAALVAASTIAGAASGPGAAAPPDLALALDRALRAPGLDPDRTAALAVDLRTGDVVYRENEARALAPASAEKLAVSFAALRLLGPDYRFRTEVAGEGFLDGRVWRGDLVLVGHGDPTLRRSDLDALARDVAGWGIVRVAGSVRGDESHFDARRGAPGWRASFVGFESRPLSALSVDGAERGRDGSALAGAAALTDALERRGVDVARRPRVGRASRDVLPLAQDLSDPLSEIVLRMNRESDNFVAEMLLKELGASVLRRGTTAAGALVVRSALEEAEVPLAGVRIVDGSGLSRLDRTTARALVTLLLAGSDDPELRGHFVASLAVAGVSGTLKRRLERRPTRGVVIAKTGTTSRASALAGFVRRKYVFAILQNGSPVPYWTARAAQDRFVTILARR